MLFRSVLRTGRSHSVALHPALLRCSYGSIPHRSGLSPLYPTALSGARPRAVPARSTQNHARVLGKPARPRMVGAAASRDGSRADPEFDATLRARPPPVLRLERTVLPAAPVGLGIIAPTNGTVLDITPPPYSGRLRPWLLTVLSNALISSTFSGFCLARFVRSPISFARL